MNDYEVIFVSFIYFRQILLVFGHYYLYLVAVYKIKFENKIQLKAKQNKNRSLKFSIQQIFFCSFSLPVSPFANGIQTHSLKIMSQVFYHCATTVGQLSRHLIALPCGLYYKHNTIVMKTEQHALSTNARKQVS